MKKLSSSMALAFLAFVSAAAGAATLLPVQLFNPTGSTSGQAIVSTGSSTAPAWQSLVNSVIAGSGVTVSGATGNVTISVAANSIALSQIAQQGANTVLANATGSTANVTAFSMPSCSTSSSALNWTSGTGFTCNTGINATSLGGATFAAPGAIGNTTASAGAFTTLSATGAITPSSTAGIVGTTTNNNAQAGSVGEYVSSSVTSGVSLTTATAANVASISLSAGDWDVGGNALVVTGSSNGTNCLIGIGTTSATFLSAQYAQLGIAAQSTTGLTAPQIRVSLASTATVYLVVQQAFASGTGTATGTIWARRRR